MYLRQESMAALVCCKSCSKDAGSVLEAIVASAVSSTIDIGSPTSLGSVSSTLLPISPVVARDEFRLRHAAVAVQVALVAHRLHQPRHAHRHAHRHPHLVRGASVVSLWLLLQASAWKIISKSLRVVSNSNL